MLRVELKDSERAAALDRAIRRGGAAAVLFAQASAVNPRSCALSFVVATLMVGQAPENALAYGYSFEPGARGLVRPLGDFPALGPRAPLQPSKAQNPRMLLAHAIVVRTSPAQGGVGAADIGKVDVWYDAGIRDAFAALAVVSASGDRVDKRDAAIDSADPAHVSVSVNPLTPGKYTVRYRALSADGHLVSGAWEFEVLP